MRMWFKMCLAKMRIIPNFGTRSYLILYSTFLFLFCRYLLLYGSRSNHIMQERFHLMRITTLLYMARHSVVLLRIFSTEPCLDQAEMRQGLHHKPGCGACSSR